MYEYPFGNGQQLNLDWFLSEWKNLLAAWEAEKNGIEGALQAEIDRAEAALADVFAARDAAAQSAANALESKNAAAQSATDASGYLATVHADANTASDAARNAAQSESNAAESAQTALASKNAAGQSAADALANKDAAAQSAADALANKDAAAQSAANALANKNAAAQSAEDAKDAASSVEASAQQIAANTNDISDLKTVFIQLEEDIIEPSVNRLNPKDFVEGKYLVVGGGLSDNASMTASGFFPVEENKTYYVYRNDTYQCRVAFYTGEDESKNIGSSLLILASTDKSFTTPANAKFARFSTNKNMILTAGIYATDIGYYIPYSIALADVVKITNQIDKTLSVEDKAADAKAVGDIFNAMNLPHIEKTYMLGGDGVVKDERLNIDTGAIVTNSSGQCRSDWIEAPTGSYVVTTGIRDICLYAEDYTYLGYYNLYTNDEYTPTSWSGNYRSNLTQIQKVNNTDVKYIRFWGVYGTYNPALVVLNDDDYVIVNLGDSIFGNNEIPYDLSTQIQNKTWKKSANCGFGSTTASQRATGNTVPICLPNLTDCIVDKDFSSLGTPAEWISKNEFLYTTQTLLLPLIDFEKVKVVTLAYGTNDYNLSVQLDNENNKFDTSTYCGGLRYAIKELQTAYPNLTVVLFAPLYRYWSNSQDYSTVDEDSNTRVNNINLKLTDYVTAMKGVAEEYGIPFFDNYHSSGLNQFSAPHWLRDGTHLNRTVGVELIGHRMAGEIDTVY